MSRIDCLIPANSDIAGIGVRTATYAQNFLSFMPAFYALTNDGKVDEKELQTTHDISITILVTAFSILISAIVQARSYGLSAFHASVILNLSWMNNTNTFIYFILWVHHRSHVDAIEPTFAAWKDYIQRQFPWRSSLRTSTSRQQFSVMDKKTSQSLDLGTNSLYQLCNKALTSFQRAAGSGKNARNQVHNAQQKTTKCVTHKASLVNSETDKP
jgi:hypothetical protein